jgi:hypothetical protein
LVRALGDGQLTELFEYQVGRVLAMEQR